MSEQCVARLKVRGFISFDCDCCGTGAAVNVECPKYCGWKSQEREHFTVDDLLAMQAEHDGVVES